MTLSHACDQHRDLKSAGGNGARKLGELDVPVGETSSNAGLTLLGAASEILAAHTTDGRGPTVFPPAGHCRTNEHVTAAQSHTISE